MEQNYKPIKIKVNHPDLPEEMLLFRDQEMIDDFVERYPGINYERLGRLALAMFRGTPEKPLAPDMDYLGIGRQEGEEYHWYIFFDRPEEITYLGGIALGKERQQIYHQMLRINDFKSAIEKFGWAPQVVVDDLPSEAEEESYIRYLLDLGEEDLHEDLERALREDMDDSA